MKKIFQTLSFAAALAVFAVSAFAPSALAATPTLTFTAGTNGDSVTVAVSGGGAGSGVILSYTKTNVGPSLLYLGSTNANGGFSTEVSASQYGISADSAVSVTVNGQQSNTATWPSQTANGTFNLSQTALVLSVNQSSSFSVNNQTGYPVYLSNNSNPPIANVNISGNQVTVTGLSNGSTVITLCAQGSSSNCASAYVTVGNSSQALTFSQSTVTVAPNQSFPVTVSGGTGSYSVLNNSNSALVQSSVSGSVVTLTANSTTGTSAVTVCSSDMSSCGIINVTVSSTANASPVTLSQTSPTLLVGQSLNVAISGGSSTAYYVSSNSNSNVVTASVSGTNLVLYGSSAGTATVTVCASSGSCGWLTATVNYAASGGPIQLSQSSLSLLAGQVLSVTVSGGTAPYSLGANTGSVVQATINGNVLTLSGIGAGYKLLSVCSAGGACTSLAVTVNASGSSSTLTFSQNNLSLPVGAAAAVTLSGNGGYYVSNSSSQNVASVQITNNIALVSALAVGNTNVSICQTGGQCSILFVGVTSGTSANLPTFSQLNPTVTAGQSLSLTVSGGTGNGYYIAANSNSNAVQASLSGSSLALSGQAAGSATLVVCAASDSCKALTVTVLASVGSAPTLSQTSLALSMGQSQTVAVSGSGSYSLSSNSNPSAASASLSGSSLVVSALAAGSTSLSVCQTGGQCATLAVTVAAASGGGTPPISTALPSGTLVNDNGTIYLIAGRLKIPFASLQAFLGLGYSLANVNTADISGYTSGGILKSAVQAHPDGSWILSGKVVFYVASAGYIPVPTWEIFLNNGGQAKFIVRANKADILDPRPILSPMASSDTRVIR